MSDPLRRLFSTGAPQDTGQGDALFLTGQPVARMMLVETGEVHLLRHTEAGSVLILHRAGPGEVLAEASAYSDSYHCDGIAVRPSRVRSIPLAAFRAGLAADPETATAWALGLARGLQRARLHSEIRSLRTVSERLEAWLSSGNRIPPKGDQQALAASLGVSREALYRELAKRRRRG